MVVGLALAATAVSSLFAQAMLGRWTSRRRPQDGAWAVALAMFAVASAALVAGTATGWDAGAFRVFYLFGAILSVPWLALGTVYLLAPPAAARRVRLGLLVFSAFGAGVLVSTPVAPLSGTTIPVGSDVLGALPRVLAAASSGVGALVIFGGAVLSAVRFARDRTRVGGEGSGRMAAANVLIASGTLVLSGGGLVQGALGHDEAFTLSLAVGITVIYAGFRVAAARSAALLAPPGDHG